MVAHTGFLLFARHQERSETWNAFRSLGTRERKQEAARLERIERLGQSDRSEQSDRSGDDATTDPA